MLWGFRSLWTRRELQIHSELTMSDPSFLQEIVGPCQTPKYLLQSSKRSVFSYLRFSLKFLHNLSRDLHTPFSYEGQLAAPTWDFSLAKRILLPMLRECRCARPEAVCWSKVMGSRPRWAKSFCSTYCKRHNGKVTAPSGLLSLYHFFQFHFATTFSIQHILFNRPPKVIGWLKLKQSSNLLIYNEDNKAGSFPGIGKPVEEPKWYWNVLGESEYGAKGFCGMLWHLEVINQQPLSLYRQMTRDGKNLLGSLEEREQETC